MPFDAAAARQFIDTDDRDVARWFVGREREIEAVDTAVNVSKDGRVQTVFRVLQGAPGVGKSSLLTHLIENAPDNRFYVRVRHEDLVSSAALDARIDHVLGEREPAAARAFGLAIRAAGHHVRAGEVADESIRDHRRQRAADLDMVLLLDEAQTIEPNRSNTVLVDLHSVGFGRPCLMLFTGLSHTADTIGAINGVSRPADTAIVNLTKLSDGECDQSTQMMLDEFHVDAAVDLRNVACRYVANVSKGWPQHLAGAQKALALQLIEHEGQLNRVDYRAVGRESDERRFRYYRNRLDNEPLLSNRRFTASVVAAIQGMNQPVDHDGLYDLCSQALKGRTIPTRLRDLSPEPGELADALVARGVLAKAVDNEGHSTDRYEIAIPSMVSWLLCQE